MKKIFYDSCYLAHFFNLNLSRYGAVGLFTFLRTQDAALSDLVNYKPSDINTASKNSAYMPPSSPLCQDHRDKKNA